MPKKVTKKLNIAVTGKKQGYWVKKENLRKGERTIKAEKDKALVLRYRSGYDYSKTITGYELTKENLELQFAKRRRVNPRAAIQDLSIRAKDTREAPTITAKQFFDFTRADIEGIDTPPRTQPSYRNMLGKVSKHPDRAYVGLMWKAKGSYRGENIHNHWFLVEKVYQGGDKVDVIRHPDAKKFTLPFTEDSVKLLIADMTNDFVGLTEKRHKNQVKQFIKRHVGSGYLVADEKGNVIQPTGEILTKRGDPRVSYLKGVKKEAKPYYIVDGTGLLLHKSTSKEGAEGWFNKFKPTDTTYKEKRWEVISKEEYEKKPKIAIPPSNLQELEKELYRIQHEKEGFTTVMKKRTDPTEKAYFQSEIDFLTEKEKHIQQKIGLLVKPETKPKESKPLIDLPSSLITSKKLGYPEKYNSKAEVAYIRQVIKDEYKQYYGENCRMRIIMGTGTGYGTLYAYGSGEKDSDDKGITAKEYYILKQLGFTHATIGGQLVMVLSDNTDKVATRLDDFQKKRTRHKKLYVRNIDSEIQELKMLRRKAQVIVDNEAYTNADDYQRQKIRMIDKELARLTSTKKKESVKKAVDRSKSIAA
ncbi:MAG: hypothetical protein KAU62_15975, partial [Candidatus Heimdallarchaeota archaeon]|nr:hypothetical protein [Candidatus Heimdallarchaeota archaeon]MCK4612655.1 hypothetical protein [Candidatus Heimdallarchaeota archaeon]